MARVLVTRPEPDASALAERLAGLGHTPIVAPLMTITPTEGPVPDLADVQALLFTSANGVRAWQQHGGPTDRPAMCVGEATAAAATAAGFAAVLTAGGDVSALAALAAAQCRPEAGALLHVAGSHRAGALAADLAARGFTTRRAVLYRQEAVPDLPDAAADSLRRGDVDGVLLLSPRTAALFVACVAAAGMTHTLARVRAYCLSDAVAAPLRDVRIADIQVAREPALAELIACLPPP